MITTASLETILATFLIGVATVLVHNSYQLSVSVLTLLSGHSLGSKRSHKRLLALNAGYILGAATATLSVLLGLMAFLHIFSQVAESVVWAGIAVIAILIGYVTFVAYYRNKKGTVLWLPRTLADYLHERAKKTKRAIEATTLGIITVVLELPFTVGPLLIAAAILTYRIDIPAQLLWATAYSLGACLSLVVVSALFGAGHRVSTIQRWREQNKTFLRYSSGAGLVLVALYIGVFYVAGGRV